MQYVKNMYSLLTCNILNILVAKKLLLSLHFFFSFLFLLQMFYFCYLYFGIFIMISMIFINLYLWTSSFHGDMHRYFSTIISAFSPKNVSIFGILDKKKLYLQFFFGKWIVHCTLLMSLCSLLMSLYSLAHVRAGLLE